MNPVNAIEIRDLRFSYDGPPVVCANELIIRRGEFATVVGPNGGGKTTLLRLILGLLEPEAGSISVLGRPPRESSSRIGYVPQHSQADQSFPVNVLDVVLMGRLGKTRSMWGYAPADADAAMSALRDVELTGHSRRAFSELSGGERQRTLIARALASEPELLLLDEPTASLDVAMENELYRILLKLKERLTIVLVSHDLAFVSDFTDVVACVNRTVALHTTSEVTPELINQLYGRDVRFVKHTHMTGD